MFDVCSASSDGFKNHGESSRIDPESCDLSFSPSALLQSQDNHQNQPTDLPNPSRDSKQLYSLLRSCILQLQHDLGYTGANCGDNFEGLVQGMRLKADETGIAYPEGSSAHRAFDFGVRFVHLCYPRHPLEVRIYAGIYTWLTVLIDDGAGKDPKLWFSSIQRFPGRKNNKSYPIIQAWYKYLKLAYKYYSTAVANFIITSSLNFVNATALEGSELKHIRRTDGGESWPYYLREKDGVGEAYVWLAFPKALCPELSMCIEAVSDMNKYLCFTNDILSFYKEEKAGEANNYVHNMAFYKGKDIYNVFQNMLKEDIYAYQCIEKVLRGREPYMQAWHDLAMGFIAFHRSNKRYRLDELDLGEEFIQTLV